MVLRYAAPALGLIVIAAIGFVVLQSNRSAKFVTQMNDEQRPAAPPAAGSDSQTFSYSTPSNSASSSETTNEKKVANKQSPVSPPPPNAAPVVSNVEADVSKDKAAQPKTEQERTAADEPPPPPKTESTATPEDSQKLADAEWRKKEYRDTPATSSPAAQRGARADEEKDRDSRAFTRAPKAADRVSGIASTGSVADLKRDELSANTRSVAGRRFQKKGGVWIDTGYDSSKDYVTLTRGSEQYRALVADEPSIKTIADELEGEIIVVWKGHTYRIR
jgi:hypothetical protein